MSQGVDALVVWEREVGALPNIVASLQEEAVSRAWRDVGKRMILWCLSMPSLTPL